MPTVYADELRPAYLQLTEVSEETYDIIWKLPAKTGRLKLSLSIGFDNTIEKSQSSIAHFINGAYIERWQVIATKGLATSMIKIEGLERTNSEVLVHINRLDGTSISHRITPDNPEYYVEKQASWKQVLITYFILGVEHILFGFDHLLFVLALLLLIKKPSLLFTTITAFTIAHSITLALATIGWVNVPVVPLEACIALSIVFVAAEIVQAQKGNLGLTSRRPWLVAFAFGLLHGLGFAAALSEVGMPENAIVSALIVFNIGVEFGQLMFVLCILLLMHAVKKYVSLLPLWLIKLPAYFIGGISSFWLIQRVSGF